MKPKQKKAKLQTKLDELMAESEALPDAVWQQRVMRLEHAIAGRQKPSAQGPLTHDEVEDLLPFFIAAEQASVEDAAQSFPRVVQHLKTCKRCREAYREVSGAWASIEASAEDAPHKETKVKEIQPQWWRRVVLPAPPHAPAPVQFRFSPGFVQAQWKRTSTAGAYRDGLREVLPIEPPEERFLLDGQIELDNQTAFVRASLVPTKRADRCHIDLKLATPKRLTHDVQVRLQWGEYQDEIVFKSGRARLKNILIPDFANLASNEPTETLALTFEPIPHVRRRTP